MCGISGVIVYSNPKAATDIYFKLLQASDIRGQDGTGITVCRKGRFITKRWDCRAREIKREDFLELEVGDRVIGQNRYAIFGLDRSNDQPIVGDEIALVHNGVLYDYERQFEQLGLKREMKVDTELILRILEKNYGDNAILASSLDEFEGEAACLAVTTSGFAFSFMKNKILFSGEDPDENLYYFSTSRIARKVPELSNIYEYKNLEFRIGAVSY